MNRKINSYVNYLLENDPSPFCEYIVYKELLHLDEQTIRDSYDWAVRFMLYNELLEEQFADGSWGGFSDSITKLSKDKHFKATARAMRRMLDLSLDIEDPMASRTIDICRKYLSGEVKIRNHPGIGKSNTSKQVQMIRSVSHWLSRFDPDNMHVREHREYTVKRMMKACIKGYFDTEVWRSSDIAPITSDFSYASVYMLDYKDCISEDLQRIWMTYEWNKHLWFGDTYPADIRIPDKRPFIFWLIRLDNIKNFSLFGEFMAENITPHLLRLCEQLVDEVIEIPIKTFNYFYHLGQYSESPRNKQQRKNDLLLRIIRLLNKCE